MINPIENSIEYLDWWMIREIDFSKTKDISELGFKQLNDLLFYKHYPQFRDNIQSMNSGDNALIFKYTILVELPTIKNFDVSEYILLVENKFKYLPCLKQLSECSEQYTKLLFQNLIIISFTLERWGQFILKNKPGVTVRSICVSEEKISLHTYLKNKLGCYNTLATFALRSTSEIIGFQYPYIENDKIKFGNKFISPSAYSDYDLNFNRCICRFPSIMKLNSFMILLKKGELISYGYNYGFFELMDRLGNHNIFDHAILQRVREISYCFKISIDSFLQFLNDPYFNESKFILILRQLTVEFSSSPATVILENFVLTTQERLRFKGFLDHYLVKYSMNKDERLLFIKEVLINENILCTELEILLDDYFFSIQSYDKDKLRILIDKFTTTTQKELLLPFLYELIEKEDMDIYRLKYALSLFIKIAPQFETFILNKIHDNDWLLEKLNHIKQLDYYLAPSGANSVAFYGPDIILGHSCVIPNYTIHMLNRLNVMIPEDQERFWKLQKYKTHNLFSFLIKNLSELISLPEEVISSGREVLNDETITNNILKYPYLALYIDLYETYSSLASVHNASVEKFIRRVGKKMDICEKEKLISSPDHGTTFMQPNLDSELHQQVYVLPSLDKMTKIRKEHFFKKWVAPLKELRQSGKLKDYPELSEIQDSQNYNQFFFSTLKSDL